jgi:hypothetical protein
MTRKYPRFDLDKNTMTVTIQALARVNSERAAIGLTPLSITQFARTCVAAVAARTLAADKLTGEELVA